MVYQIREGESPPGSYRTWQVVCKCGERAIVSLKHGKLEEWLMSRLACPGGRHRLSSAGAGLSASLFFPPPRGEAEPPEPREPDMMGEGEAERAERLEGYRRMK